MWLSGSFLETLFVQDKKLLDPQVGTDLSIDGKQDIYAAVVILGEGKASVYHHYSKFLSNEYDHYH